MNLKCLRDQLETVEGLMVSERGTGRGKFLFVRSAARALEIYIEDVGYVIEYWNNADEEADDPPVNRDVVAFDSDALARIQHWLGASNG
jgi:hypothetical protein